MCNSYMFYGQCHLCGPLGSLAWGGTGYYYLACDQSSWFCAQDPIILCWRNIIHFFVHAWTIEIVVYNCISPTSLPAVGLVLLSEHPTFKIRALLVKVRFFFLFWKVDYVLVVHWLIVKINTWPACHSNNTGSDTKSWRISLQLRQLSNSKDLLCIHMYEKVEACICWWCLPMYRFWWDHVGNYCSVDR